MVKSEEAAKQPKKRSRAGIVVLVILLLLIGGAGYLYYSVVKVPLALDDPEKMAASTDMTAGERFRFSAADQTVQVKMDAADIWSVILTHAGDDILTTINQEIEPYSLSVSGCAIHLDEKGLRLDLELFYKETRLVVRVPCNMEISGSSITLNPTGVKLGVISLPVKKLLSDVKLTYDLTLPVITDVTGVEFTQDAILLTGPMGQDIRMLIPADQNLYKKIVFLDSLRPLADALHTNEGFVALLSGLEQDPGKVEDVYRALFTLADLKDSEIYLKNRHGMTRRFFPGIDFSAIEVEQAAMNEQLNPMTNSLDLFFTKAVNDYNDKNFRLKKGEFLYKGKAFDAAKYGKGQFEELFEVLNPEDIFLILVDVDNGFIRKTSSFYRMADEGLQFTQSVDYNKTYILGCVFRSPSGEPFVMYETEIHENNTYSRVISVTPLTEEQVSALQVPETFGVWTDG